MIDFLLYCHLIQQKVGLIGDKIKFYENLKEVSSEHFNIVYLNTVLQYIDDTEALISKLTELKPEYFVFSRLLAGEVKSHKLIEKVLGHDVETKIINVHDFRKIMGNKGYFLLFKSNTPYEDFKYKYDKSIKDGLRIPNSISLVFKRERA